MRCWVDMRLETARHPSRKWSGTYLGSLVPSVILLIKITSVIFFVFGGKLVHSLAILNINTNRFVAHGWSLFIYLVQFITSAWLVFYLFVELFKNCALAPVHVKAFLAKSRSHCRVLCHALHVLQYATNKHPLINRRFVFIGKISTVNGQKIKSGYKQLLDEVFVISRIIKVEVSGLRW